ncbi:MAG TPA: response regulator [Terriglobales bacterium]|nr:response regulator [Terriglobales bacterium]
MGPVRKAILIVDDDPELCRLLLRLLHDEDLDVETCGTGAEAEDLLLRRSWDLVLLDLGLPDFNGMELLERYYSEDGPRFLIITADETSESVLRAVKDQAYGYVRKPFDPKELVHLVRESLEAPRLPAIEVISAKPEWFELSVPCSRNAAERVDQFMRQITGLPEELRDSVAQCFRELLMNAVEWGGGLDPTRRVRISYLRTPRMLQYRISDPGPGFKFEELAHAAVGHAGGDLITHTTVRAEKGIRPGGFGLLMVKAMADELVFNEKQNEVVFIKYLDQPATGGET